MMESFNRQVLRVAVAQICQSMGWDALQKSTHDALTDVMQRYLEEIGKVAYGYTQLCNRTKPNLDDLHLAFQDTGVAVDELENYVAQVDSVQFIHPFTTYPRCRPCRLQHPSKGEIVDRADFYSEHLPPLPKVYEEPTCKVESEENTPEESAKVLSPEESEKMKTSPLKESNHAVEKSENLPAKRLHDGHVWGFPESKRARLDIPPNIILEKKENLENTDGESLSPATPVSPYLPQEIPKVPDEPAKEAITVKVKTEPKKVFNSTKELVLSLPKITPPDHKKIKSETSPSSKKPKVKAEKSASPKVQKKSPLSGARAESPLSGRKIPKAAKKSPSPKLKSPVKAISPVKAMSPAKTKLAAKATSPAKAISPTKTISPAKAISPLVDKSPLVVKKFPEKLSIKQESPLTSPVKRSPSKKPSPSVTVKKEITSHHEVKPPEDKQPKKKKKKVTDGLKSPQQASDFESESLSTPKLMIKLLPKSDVGGKLSKSSQGESKRSTTPVKTKKVIGPESKKKLKIKATSFESVAKPVKKDKVSGGFLESVVKKEHNKKKKKKKDKDKEKGNHKEKHKIPKTDKTEPPIPKIRFKLDPSGESKVVETKATGSSKIITSPGQTSSKQSSIVIETEKVSRSIITETLSNNTLDYDPSKAYFCPVCKKKDDGSPMVGCDGCDEWCHWACVGLIAAPPEDEKWYCPQCLLRREKSKKGKSKKKH